MEMNVLYKFFKSQINASLKKYKFRTIEIDFQTELPFRPIYYYKTDVNALFGNSS